MCIIGKYIKKVSNTKILVGPNETHDRQIVIYSNEVINNCKNNVMILPVPYPDTIEFIDLSNYTNIFEDCQKSFNLNTTLPVHNLDNYLVSIAYSLDDIKMIDPLVFQVSDRCEKLLTETYGNLNFGFLICKLNDISHQLYHPLAYSHKILPNNKLFIPTKYHCESRLSNNTYYGNLMNDNWSHEIYLYNGTGKNNKELVSMAELYNLKGNSSLNLSNLNFPLGKLNSFELYKINGYHANIDLIVSCN